MIEFRKVALSLFNLDKRGTCFGTWAALAKYDYKLFWNNKQERKLLFVIKGLQNIDFEKGGEIECECYLSYELSNVGDDVPLSLLINLAVTAPKQFETVCNMKLLSVESVDILWRDIDKETIGELVRDTLERYNFE